MLSEDYLRDFFHLQKTQPPLTRRELFAAMAMQGMVADDAWHGSHEDFACIAVAYADALITELDKPR